MTLDEVMVELRRLQQQRNQDLAAMQENTVRLQQHASRLTVLIAALTTIVGPLPDVPELSLNTRPRN